jgi:hypothetical protein
MDNDDFFQALWALLALLGLFLGLSYGTYKYGRFVERRLLTEVFMKTMEQDYLTGYSAAQSDCRQGVFK